MIDQLIQKFSESCCFAPTFGCASLMLIYTLLVILKVPFLVVDNLVEAVKNLTKTEDNEKVNKHGKNKS